MYLQFFHLGWTAVDSVFDLATSLVADDRIAAIFCSEVAAVAIYFIFISGQQPGCFCGIMDISCCCLHGMNQSAVPVNADMCLIAEVPGIAFLHLMCIRVPLLFLVIDSILELYIHFYFPTISSVLMNWNGVV